MSRRPPRPPARGPADPWRQARPRPASVPAPGAEQRLYGLNACLAAFAHRPHALRKLYLSEARIPDLRPVLAWCVQHRLGYRVVETADLDRLAASRHHQGVCMDLRPMEPVTLGGLLGRLPAAPAPVLLLWLDGVGNPHNLGAILRSAAHFGAAAVLVPEADGLDVSGAAARVAEGAAETVPLVRVPGTGPALARLREACFALAATVPEHGEPVHAVGLPARLLLMLGAEGEGMARALIAGADLALTIPGTGAVQSLNVSVSAAVLMAEYRRQRVAGGG